MALVNAVVTNLDTGDEVEVMFNPSEYQVDKTTYWEPHRAPGLDAPEIEFTLGGSETLAMDLHFDTWEDGDGGSDVRVHTEQLRSLTLVDPDLHRPPICLFSWGGFTFKGILERLTQRFTMFNDAGVPVRARCAVRFKQFESGEAQLRNSPRNSADHTKRVTVKAGQTLTSIASAEYGDPMEWRRIARANDLDDPTDVPPGTVLTLPPLR